MRTEPQSAAVGRPELSRLFQCQLPLSGMMIKNAADFSNGWKCYQAEPQIVTALKAEKDPYPGFGDWGPKKWGWPSGGSSPKYFRMLFKRCPNNP